MKAKCFSHIPPIPDELSAKLRPEPVKCGPMSASALASHLSQPTQWLNPKAPESTNFGRIRASFGVRSAERAHKGEGRCAQEGHPRG